LPVTLPCALLLELRLVEDQATWDADGVASTGERDDTGVTVRGCGVEQCRQQELGEQRVAHMIGAELYLVALFCRAVWASHDSGVVDQDVEACLGALESGGSAGDRGKRGQVERKVNNFAAFGY